MNPPTLVPAPRKSRYVIAIFLGGLAVMIAVASSLGVLLVRRWLAQTRGVPVALPAAPTAFEAGRLVLAITPDHRVRWNGGSPIAFDALPSRLTQLHAARPDAQVQIIADPRVPFDDSVRILDAVRAAGFSRILIETRVTPAPE